LGRRGGTRNPARRHDIGGDQREKGEPFGAGLVHFVLQPYLRATKA